MQRSIIERKLFNCFGIFVSYIFTKNNVEHGFGHDVDSPYRVNIYDAFLNFMADLINTGTLQFKPMMIWTVY